MRKWNRISLWALLVILILSLTGCGGASKSYVVAETAAASAMMSQASMAPAALADQNVSYRNAPMEKYEYSAEEAGSGHTNALNSTTGLDQTQAVNRKLIRNVHLNVETDTFDELLPHLQQQITGLSGYIENSDVSGTSMHRRNNPPNRHASITARIPSDQLDQFIGIVENSGNITYRSESTTDVTLRYTDLESRKKSLSIEQDRIWELLEKADTLEAVIQLEQRLSEIRYELESMESQLRLYDNQVAYSTVYINIDEVSTFTQVEPETIGQQIKREFLENLRDVGDAVTDLTIHIITSSPVWIPLLLIALIVVKIFKRRKRARNAIYEAAASVPTTLDSSEDNNLS